MTMKRFTKGTNYFMWSKENKIDKIDIFLYINGGDLCLKIRPMQRFTCT